MCDRESAEAIIAKFDNTPIPGNGTGLSLQIRFADSPSQKRLKNQTQKRRLWRAREYNILTGKIPLDDGHLDLTPVQSIPGMMLLNPLTPIPYGPVDTGGICSFQNYPPTSAMLSSLSTDLYANLGQPRIMPDQSTNVKKCEEQKSTKTEEEVTNLFGSSLTI